MKESIKFIILSILLGTFLFNNKGHAQETLIVVYFNDKGPNPSYDLSQESLERRDRQNIPLRASDFNVNMEYVQAIRSADEKLKWLYNSRWLNAALFIGSDTNQFNNLSSDMDFIKRKEYFKIVRHKSLEQNSSIAKTVKPQVNIPKSYQNRFEYGFFGVVIQQIGLTSLHNEGYAGRGLRIAVMDNGFTRLDKLPNFQTLVSDGRIFYTKDIVEGKDSVFDGGSHGTDVMSCLSTYIPDTLIATAPEATYALFKTEEGKLESRLEEFNWLRAAEIADSLGCDILSTSLGYSRFNQSVENYTFFDINGDKATISIAADIAASKGMLVVNSAGNSGAFPPPYDWYYVTPPADGDSVLAVGATGLDSSVANFSSRGPTAEGKIKPNTLAPGFGVPVYLINDTLYSASGTSFSCPIVSGGAACLWQKHPNASSMDVYRAIEASSSHFAFPDSVKGYGIVNFQKADSILNQILSESNDELNTLFIYPNPARENFNLSFSSETEGYGEITFTELNGASRISQEVFVRKGPNDMRFYKLHLPQGIYLVRIIVSETEKVFLGRIMVDAE